MMNDSVVTFVRIAHDESNHLPVYFAQGLRPRHC
jgi:hypothetical protein